MFEIYLGTRGVLLTRKVHINIFLQVKFKCGLVTLISTYLVNLWLRCGRGIILLLRMQEVPLLNLHSNTEYRDGIFVFLQIFLGPTIHSTRRYFDRLGLCNLTRPIPSEVFTGINAGSELWCVCTFVVEMAKDLGVKWNLGI